MRPTRFILIGLAALAFAASALTGTARADIVAGQYSLEATPSASNVAVGGQFSIDVGIYHSTGAYQAVQWALDYNSTVVDVVSISESQMPGTCLTNDNGDYRVYLGCLDLAGPTLTHSGKAFDVVFQCTADGTAALHLNTDPPSRTFVKIEDVPQPSHTHAGTVTCGAGSSTPPPPPPGDHCTVESVISGDTFTCTDDRTVRMLQIDAPDTGECGGAWAKAALQYIFLTPGRVVTLQTDTKLTNSDGEVLAAPLWTGFDGATYNLSIVMVYVGLAKAANLRDGNTRYLDWATASQAWAKAAKWNMWAPNKTYTGGCD